MANTLSKIVPGYCYHVKIDDISMLVGYPVARKYAQDWLAQGMTEQEVQERISIYLDEWIQYPLKDLENTTK